MATRRWIRGNTHTHTTYSDGDSPPEIVVDWYAEHGYDFLFLTDHNALVPEDHLARLQRHGLAVWQGEEVTMALVHVNGLGVQELIAPTNPGRGDPEPADPATRAERVRWAVARVRAQGAVATVNHPNAFWLLGEDELLASGDVGLLEVANGHYLLANKGDAEHPSTEALWDRLLVEGRQVWGVASDDAHHFQRWGHQWANPGRGWLWVESESTRVHDCLVALREGRFYASSGPELADYRATSAEIALELTRSATVELVGSEGRVLDVVEGPRARFKLARAGSPYVRVRATDPNGFRLWTQPLFL